MFPFTSALRATRLSHRDMSSVPVTAGNVRKDHRCAIAIVPPCHIWHDIQVIRSRNDKSFLRLASQCLESACCNELLHKDLPRGCQNLCLCLAFTRWPPHINLVYPFVEDNGSALESSAEAARVAIAGISAFKVTLQSFVLASIVECR